MNLNKKPVVLDRSNKTWNNSIIARNNELENPQSELNSKNKMINNDMSNSNIEIINSSYVLPCKNNNNNIAVNQRNSNNNINANTSSNEKDTKSYLEIIEQLKQHAKTKVDQSQKNGSNINFGYWFKIKFLFCRNSLKKKDPHREKVFDILNSFLDERLDLISYLKYLNKIDKLKSIYFNQNQELAFDYEHKPSVFNLEEMGIFLRKKMANDDPQIKEFILNYFNNLIKTKSITDLDLKIIEKLPHIILSNIDV